MSNIRGWGAAGLLAASLFLTRAVSAQMKPVLAGNALTLQAGDYQVDFQRDSAWTLGNVKFENVPIISRTGANQTVINVKSENPGGTFVGTSHGGEIVENVSLKIDGVSYPLTQPFAAPEGHEYLLVKDSTIGPFHNHTETGLSPEGITQSITLKAAGNTDTVRYLYVFMHCWTSDMTKWLAIAEDNQPIDGTFPPVKETSLKRDISMLAVYSEDKHIGAVLSYPEPYVGDKGYSNFLINWPGRHNKHYLRVRADQVTDITFQSKITGFSAEATDWTTKALEIGRSKK